MNFLISEENKDKSGIYIIRNSINNRVYIGSAANFLRRYRLHISELKRKTHHSILLQSFVQKHGIASLTFECLELAGKADVLQKEQHYLDLFQSFNRLRGFNVSPTAGSQKDFRLINEERQFTQRIQSLKKLIRKIERKIEARTNIRKSKRERNQLVNDLKIQEKMLKAYHLDKAGLFTWKVKSDIRDRILQISSSPVPKEGIVLDNRQVKLLQLFQLVYQKLLNNCPKKEINAFILSNSTYCDRVARDYAMVCIVLFCSMENKNLEEFTAKSSAYLFNSPLSKKQAA